MDRVRLWHYAGDGRTYHNTKTEVSADGQTWEMVYDSAVSGEYPETAEGKTLSFTARPVRYVRDWLNGSTANAGNHWVEIQVWGQVGRAFVGEYLEWSGGESVQHYYAGPRLIGLRGGGAVSFVLSDHLGSPSTLVGMGGELQASRRYTAWGETRMASGASGLGVGYTGQEQAIGLGGLHDYGARWFDPSIMQFQQPDTLVPDPYHPQDWNRYGYARYNPVRYLDPSGHRACDADGNCDTPTTAAPTWTASIWARLYGIKFTGKWTNAQKRSAIKAVRTIGARFSGQIGGTSWDAFQNTFGSMEMEFCDSCVSDGWGWGYDDHHIKFDAMYDNPETAVRFITHEFGHILDRAVCAANSASGQCENIFAKTGTARADLTGNMGTCKSSSSCLGRKDHKGPEEGEFWGFAGGWGDWQYGQDHGTGEVWADMFVGWVFNTWGGDSRGTNRQGYMNNQMAVYLLLLGSR